MQTHKLLPLLAVALLGAGIVLAADKDKDAKPEGVPATYPLKKCPVSDGELGGMGKPVKVTYDGADVYRCCKNCLKDFNKSPAEFVAKVKASQKK